MTYIDLGFQTDLLHPVAVRSLPSSIVYGDNKAHRFTVTCTEGLTPKTLTGTVTAAFVRNSNDYVALRGTLVDGAAVVVLPSACYAVPGNAALLIRIVDGEQKTTILNLRCVVGATLPETIIDPGSVITQSIEDLIALIEETAATIPEDYTALTAQVGGIQSAQIYDEIWIRAHRSAMLGESVTDTGAKGVAAGTAPSFGHQIIVGTGTSAVTYSGTTAPVKAGEQYQVSIANGQSITAYQWEFDSNGTWRNATLPGNATATMKATTVGQDAKRIGYKFRCKLNGSYYSDVFTLIDTSWRDIAPTCSVSGKVVSVTDHTMGIVPAGLRYDVRVNGASVGSIPYSATASARTLTLTTAPGANDVVECVPVCELAAGGSADVGTMEEWEAYISGASSVSLMSEVMTDGE